MAEIAMNGFKEYLQIQGPALRAMTKV